MVGNVEVKSIMVLNRVVKANFFGKMLEQRLGLKMRGEVASSRDSEEASMASLKEERVRGMRKLNFFAFGRRELEVKRVWAEIAFLCHKSYMIISFFKSLICVTFIKIKI